MGEGGASSIIPADLGGVWTAVGSFFENGLQPAIDVIAGNAFLVAPLCVFIASRVLGQAKSLFKVGGRRRG